jgi:SEC-C motif
MFASCRTDDEFHRPTAEMLRILRAAGCDTTEEGDLQMGMVAYNAALLASRHAGNRSVQPAWRSRAGRNEPCPCGSGRKYKKCCLDKDRAPSPDNDHSLVVNFGPEILPRLWDDDAMVEDCAVLGRIMERDQAFAKVGFSTERVASFVDAVFEKETSPFRNADQDDADTYAQAIDDLAVQYIRESGDRKVTQGIKDKLLAAIRRAQSKDEVRALATGLCLALRADITKDPADDLLGIILFRRALFAAATPARIFNKVFDRLGIDEDELRRLIEANDPSIKEKIESAIDELDASERKALEASFDRRHKNLWETIAAGKFPVPMPFATQAALSGRVASANDTSSLNDLAATIITFCDELIEDDYVIYGQMLDRWLRNSNERSDQIVDAVRMMRELCGIRAIKDLAPRLLGFCLRKGLAIPFDEEERNFIDGDHSVGEKFEFIAKYGSWLETKGYPGMANRLLLCWETGDTSSERLPLRKSSFG